MILNHATEAPLPNLITWEERFERGDEGLLLAWARGREMAQEQPELAAAALRGELPPLVWTGGLRKRLVSGRKYGSLQYLAMWQGLRGDPLHIDTDENVLITCARHGTTVTFTDDLRLILNTTMEQDQCDLP